MSRVDYDHASAAADGNVEAVVVDHVHAPAVRGLDLRIDWHLDSRRIDAVLGVVEVALDGEGDVQPIRAVSGRLDLDLRPRGAALWRHGVDGDFDGAPQLVVGVIHHQHGHDVGASCGWCSKDPAANGHIQTRRRFLLLPKPEILVHSAWGTTAGVQLSGGEFLSNLSKELLHRHLKRCGLLDTRLVSRGIRRRDLNARQEGEQGDNDDGSQHGANLQKDCTPGTRDDHKDEILKLIQDDIYDHIVYGVCFLCAL